jgi:hypothetical protein
MIPTCLASAAGMTLALGVMTAAASATPATMLDMLKSQAAQQSAIEQVQYGPCVWGRFRGWHRNGPYGTWKSCRPGAGWRYERSCWFGPGGVRYCRFS